MDFFQELTLGEKKGVPFYRLYINGEWMESAKNESFEVFNPADGGLVAHVAKSGVNEAAKAVEAAFLARSAMEDLSPFERSEILLKAADLLKEKFGVETNVWSVTSYKNLLNDALDVDRDNVRVPSIGKNEKKTPYIFFVVMNLNSRTHQLAG